jgi:hypothetical protein
MNESSFELLVAEFDWHGAKLAPHLIESARSAFGVTESGVRKRLDRYLGHLEVGWSLQRDFDLRRLQDIEDAADALDAYRRLRLAGVAPPTYRLFRHIFIDAPGYPELRGLRDRELAVLKLAARGQGPRACAKCASWIRGQLQ